jgi:hypothetical protein
MKAALLLSVLTTIAFASQPRGETPQFTLTISAPQRIVLGENVVIEIKIANTSEAPESFVFEHHGGLAEGYKYEVLNEEGEQVPLVEHPPTRFPDGSVLIAPSRAPGSTMLGEIKPGKYILEASILSDRFRFDRPGTYTIRVSRAPSWSPRVYSNMITVRIVEKPKDAPALQ